MKIRSIIMTGFIFSILLIGGILYFNFSESIDRSSEFFEEFTSEDLEVLILLNEINRIVNILHVDIVAYMSDIHSSEKNINELLDQLDQLIRDYNLLMNFSEGDMGITYYFDFDAVIRELIAMKNSGVSIEELNKKEEKDFHNIISMLVLNIDKMTKTHLETIEQGKIELKEFHKSQKRTVIIIFGILFIFSVGFSFFVSKFLAKSINDLSQKVDEISKGKLDVQLGQSNIFEIQILTSALNRVLASLKLAILKVGIKKRDIGLGEIVREKEEIEKKYFVFFENANDLIQRVGINGNFLEVNRKWREALGYSREEALKLNLKDIIHPDHLSHCMQKFQEVVKGTSVSNIKTILLTKKGKEISVEVNASPVFDKNGKFSSTMGIFRIINEKSSEKSAVQKVSNSTNLTTKKTEDKISMTSKAKKQITPKNSEKIKKYFLKKK